MQFLGVGVSSPCFDLHAADISHFARSHFAFARNGDARFGRDRHLDIRLPADRARRNLQHQRPVFARDRAAVRADRNEPVGAAVCRLFDAIFRAVRLTNDQFDFIADTRRYLNFDCRAAGNHRNRGTGRIVNR